MIALALASILIVGTVGLYYLSPGSGPPGSLPIPAGTVFSQDDIDTWFAQFTVPEFPMRIVGSWTAVDGRGSPRLVVVNGTVTRPAHSACPAVVLPHWDQSNGTIDVSVEPGAHTVYWGFCFGASKIAVTAPIRLAAFGLGG